MDHMHSSKKLAVSLVKELKHYKYIINRYFRLESVFACPRVPG